MGNPKTRTGGFKPYGIRPPVIIAMIVASLVLAAVIEFLAQRSKKHGGLGLVQDADDLSTSTTFGYLYAPTIISVTYGLTWAWVDLDARRMQPWIELSRPKGSSAQNSLLLDYPFGFLALVPFDAWRRKHYPVFFAGTALVLIFWGITPLTSAVFGTKSVELTENTPAFPSTTLVPVGEQADKIDGSILHEAYAVSWLDQAYPAFTTPEYAVLPVLPDDGLDPLPKELWTVETTKLTTELDCWPANVTVLSNSNTTLYAIYDNNRGCSNTISLSPPKGQSKLLYIGWKDEAHLDYSLEDPNCTAEAAHQFLALWVGQTGDSDGTQNDASFDYTASFCEPSYLQQDVSVKIARNESRPVEVVPLGPTRTLDSTEFNSTAFEFFLNVGIPPVTKTRDLPASGTLEAFPDLEDLGVNWPATNMVIYALGLLGKPASALQDPTTLHEAFAAAHRTLFSITIPQLLSPTENPELSEGVRKYTMYGVVISRPISAVVEGLLFLVAILAFGLLVTSWQSPCKLSDDPASLGFTFRILKASKTVLDRFTDQDSADDKTLHERLAGERYALVEDESTPEGLKLEVMKESGQTSPTTSFQQHISYLPVQPEWLRAFTGAVFISGLVVGMVLLVYFKAKERELNGLPRPSDNDVVLQIIENYVPMVFCTLLEPFLVLLTRLMCAIQPFKDLKKGGSTAEKTIESRYNSLPPQVIILQSLKSRHFLLAALSLLTILAQGLAVSLGGVFNEDPVVISYPATFQQQQTTTLGRQTIKKPSIAPVEDHTYFYVAVSNYTSNTSLPAWTAPDFAFLPVSPNEEVKFSRNESEPTFRAQVRGFGAEPKCVPLPTDPSTRPAYANISRIEIGTNDPNFVYQHPNGSMIVCETANILHGKNATDMGISSRQFASSVMSIEKGANFGVVNDGGFCKEKMVMGWLRADSKDIPGSIKSTFISCEPVLKTAMFDVEFSLDGRVQKYERVGELEDPDEFLDENMAREFMREANKLIGNPKTDGILNQAWNNESVAMDWQNYVLRAKLNSDELIDPTKPVPSHDFVIPIVEEFYKRSFAILLSINTGFFEAAPQDDPAFSVQGEYLVEETRIFLEDPALYISLAIMALNIIVLVAVYYSERRPFLPRMPSNLASQIAFVAASRMIRGYGDKGPDQLSTAPSWNNLLDRDSLDVGETGSEGGSRGGGDHGIEQHGVMLASPGGEAGAPEIAEKDKTTMTAVKTKLREKKNQLRRETYSFGRYRGVDGNMHVGIEVDPLVTGIDKSMLQKRQSTFSSWMSKEGGGGRTPAESPGVEGGGGSVLGGWFRRRNRGDGHGREGEAEEARG